MSKNIRIGISFTVVLVLAGAGIYFFKKNSKKQTQVEVAQVAVDPILEEDRKNLTLNKEATQYQVYSALVRLSLSGDQLASNEAFKRAASDKEWERAGAADALGRSEKKEAIALLQKMIADPSLVVRVQVLKAIAYRNTPENIQLLKDYLAGKEISPKEKMQALYGLIRLTTFPEKRTYIEKAVAIVSELKNNDKTALWLELSSLAPKEDVVLQYMEKVLKTEDDEEMEAIAIRHMSSVSPERIRTKIHAFSVDKRMKVRLAAIQSLPIACPLERISILRTTLQNEKDSLVWRTAVQSAGMMANEEVREILKNLEKKTLAADDMKYVTDSIKRLSVNNSDPCPSSVGSK